MLRLILVGVLLVFLLLGTAAMTMAQAPMFINYQGMLADSTGQPLDTTLGLNFHIFSDTLGSVLLWSESHPEVTVKAGSFSVLLGTTTPIDGAILDGQVRGMAVEIIGGDVTSTLMPIVSVAYSVRSIYADTADFALSGGSGGGGYWALSGSTLETVDQWGISRGNANNQVIGDSARTLVNLGVSSTVGSFDSTYAYATVGGGRANQARRYYATVGGGEGNLAIGEHSTIAGGRFNEAHGNRSVVAGGNGNIILGNGAAILGGGANTANGDNAGVVAGWDNDAFGYRSFVGGGSWNKVYDNYSFIGAGYYNVADGNAAVVVGGQRDSAMYDYATIVGGLFNTATGYASFIGGGEGNRAEGVYATASGAYNRAEGYGATVSGGTQNRAILNYSSVVGGMADTAGGEYSIAGGAGNTAGANYSVALGGEQNRAEAVYSTAVGGRRNVVQGDYSAILGGLADTITATADYSYLFGLGSKLTQDSTFMIDLPHIRIGDEATGYELPVVDGTAGYALTTDGAGKASWTEISGGGGGYWTLSGSTLLTNGFYALSRGGTGNILYGDSSNTHVNWAVGGQTGESDSSHAYATVGGGWSNKARRTFATVAGGDRNDARGEHSTIGGGRANAIVADARRATIAGGNGNIAHGSSSFIGGGGANQTFGNDAIVVGGWDNDNYGWRSFIGGGSWNKIDEGADFASLAGGEYNAVLGLAATVGGGLRDSASGSYSFVGGGSYNHAVAQRSTVGGGHKNYVAGDYASVLGGYADTITATGDYSYLFGYGSKLTAAQTFMVDMPHIRFGDEATGYEFPTSDGSASQVLATNGAGQLSWVDQGGGAGTGGGGWTDDGANVRLTTSTDKVGVGTATPTGKFEVSATSGKAVYGRSASPATTGYALYGEATDTHTAPNIGVYGSHTNSGNYGRMGTAMYGVEGVSNVGMLAPGSYGIGVRGINTTSGYGVYAKSSGAFGLVAETDGANTAAVHARYTSDLIWGQLATNAAGVFGYNNGHEGHLATAGYGVAGYGDNDTAVLAEAMASGGVGLMARGGDGGYAAILEGNLLIRSRTTGIEIVELGEGLDYAEGFDIHANDPIEPGTVVSIDPNHPGRLAVCREAYDSKVAGIVAGANGLGSGVRLGAGQFDHDVALAGRVYCKVDAGTGGIQPGDLLTTSSTPGHAQKADDYSRAHGAILGKAMEPLGKGEKGTILVLVTLQ